MSVGGEDVTGKPKLNFNMETTVCTVVGFCSFGTSTNESIRDKFFYGLATENHVHYTTGT